MDIKIKLDKDDHYDGINKVEYIVIHDTGNFDDSDEGNVTYFCGGARKASAHYFVDDDSATQLVLDKDGAWHCGDGENRYGINNHNSLGIEMCKDKGKILEATIARTLELTLDKMIQYKVPLKKVVRHYDASRKICPRSMSGENWAGW
jgi:N-acetylmuramoyl-L-alanine amidase CwlA